VKTCRRSGNGVGLTKRLRKPATDGEIIPAA
jgi:hypothetical protein